ncbi:hypothetical protein DFH09DRAFT_1360569 [Mycena vulgaris]|nr:hypothetical protein DFH09DRAFT_1360569 [Mycena vulgaris]
MAECFQPSESPDVLSMAARSVAVIAPPLDGNPKVATKPQTKKPAAPVPPVTFCPLPARKPAVRRFLEYIGLHARSTAKEVANAEDAAAIAGGADPAAVKAARVKKNADAGAAAGAEKDALAKKKAADLTAAAVGKAAVVKRVSRPPLPCDSAESSLKPIGTVVDKPTKPVQCPDRDDGLTVVPLDEIEEAGVAVPAGCVDLEEQAVGKGMSAFSNEPAARANFN